MITLDSSVIAAIIIFLVLVFLLNKILFRPIVNVQAERAHRTTGQLELAKAKLDRHLELFQRYQETIRNTKLEAYRRQEELRNGALNRRAELLAGARKDAERMIQESRTAIQSQVASSKEQLARDAQEIARGISAKVLERTA